MGRGTPPLAPPEDSGTQASVGLGWVQGEMAPSAPPSLGCWKHSEGTPFCSPGPHSLVQHSGWRRQAAHETLPGRAQPLGRYLLPPHSPACLPMLLLSRASPGGKSQLHWAYPWEVPRMGPPPSQAGSPPPCSTMRGALCRAGVQGTSRQGTEAGNSLDQVGTLSTSDQEDLPSPHGLPPLLWAALYFASCFFSLGVVEPLRVLEHLRMATGHSNCCSKKPTMAVAPPSHPGQHASHVSVRRSHTGTSCQPARCAEDGFLRLLGPGPMSGAWS